MKVQGLRVFFFIFALSMGSLSPFSAFAVGEEAEFLENFQEDAIEGLESEVQGRGAEIRCPSGFAPTEIIPGKWICISELEWDQVRPRRKSLSVCFDTGLPVLDRVCVKLRIECQGEGNRRSCTLEIIPPWPLPEHVCTFSPDLESPGQFVVDCPAYPGFRIRDREIIERIPGFLRRYRVLDDGNSICVEDPDLQQSICFQIEDIYRIPGIRDLVPVLPGFAEISK